MNPRSALFLWMKHAKTRNNWWRNAACLVPGAPHKFRDTTVWDYLCKWGRHFVIFWLVGFEPFQSATTTQNRYEIKTGQLILHRNLYLNRSKHAIRIFKFIDRYVWYNDMIKIFILVTLWEFQYGDKSFASLKQMWTKVLHHWTDVNKNYASLNRCEQKFCITEEMWTKALHQ
jgi:hypothetical protein